MYLPVFIKLYDLKGILLSSFSIFNILVEVLSYNCQKYCYKLLMKKIVWGQNDNLRVIEETRFAQSYEFIVNHSKKYHLIYNSYISLFIFITKNKKC